MRKIFAAILTLSGLYTSCFAQTKTGVEFGLNAGYNIAYVQETGFAESSDVSSGFNLGASAEYRYSDRWGIKAKVIYDQKGWGNGFLIADDGSEIDRTNFQLNYITIPVMATLHFGRLRNWYLSFGPYAGFLLSASESSSGADVKSVFNSTDYGIAVGIGVKFPVSDKMKLFIEDDGQAGINNIFKSNSDNASLENKRSGINIGILWGLD
jgi:opacity protein-like surface antigen